MNAGMTKEQNQDAGAGSPSAAPEIKKSKVKKAEALWLTSFSDLSLILIAFFVLQLSYSKVDKKKYDNIQTSMNAKIVEKKDDNLKVINDKLMKELKKQKLDQSASVQLNANGLAVEFKDGLLFGSGSAKSNPKFVQTVGAVMKLIAASPDRYHVVIEGHTDDTPMRSKDFQSNWELSAARGFALMRQFKSRGVREDRMSVEAFAQTRPKVAIAGLKGDALDKARAANRRVVIRIE